MTFMDQPCHMELAVIQASLDGRAFSYWMPEYRARVAREYTEVVGYNPFTDDPEASTEAVASHLSEIKDLHAAA